MPTITYAYEPTDEVYIIDYSEDLKTETVIKGTIYRLDLVVRNKIVTGSPTIEQVPSPAEIEAAQLVVDAALVTLNDAIAARDTAQEALDEQQRQVAINPLLTTDAEAIALGLAQDAVTEATAAYDLALVDTEITVEAQDAVEEVMQGLVKKYVLRTAYNESVVIEDEDLIFTDKTAAFDALELRTA